ncbi:MAG: hypothetical protein ACSHX7_14670, partial [Luteolibacter sp.]
MLRNLSLAVATTGLSLAQQAQKDTILPGNVPSGIEESPDDGLQAADQGSILNRKDARTITLKIPAPRGQIVDRNGEPMAQNEVAYQVALQFEQFQDVDREYVVEWARKRTASLEGLVRYVEEKTDDELYDHYRHRRWLPLYL